MFPDAEGWENMDPDEAAKWAVGNEFPPGVADQSQGDPGRTAGMHTGTVLTFRTCGAVGNFLF